MSYLAREFLISLTNITTESESARYKSHALTHHSIVYLLNIDAGLFHFVETDYVLSSG